MVSEIRYKITEDTLSAHPDLTSIFAVNEPGVIGAAEAAKKAGLVGKVMIIGRDAAPDESRAVQQGAISALVVPNPFKMSYDGLNVAVQELRRRKMSIGQRVTIKSPRTGFLLALRASEPWLLFLSFDGCEIESPYHKIESLDKIVQIYVSLIASTNVSVR